MSSASIHPTAIIAESAHIGAGVKVGPYAIIGEQVHLGDQTVIEAHAVIHAYVTMGKQNHVHPFAAIGGLPQDISFDPDLATSTRIGDANTFREGVTINRASFENKATQIGNHCYFMNCAHVGHDCVVGDNNIFASQATLGGHTHVGDRIFFGGGAMVHQFCRVGSYAMIAGIAPVTQDVIPFTLLGRSPVRHYRLNSIGLRRAGIVGPNFKALSTAFRLLRAKKPLDDLPDTTEIKYLRNWLAEESKRGIHGFITTKGKDTDSD